MPKSSVSELFQLYKQDKLVVHTMPTSMVDKRPQHMADKTSMMCGSILFYAGLEHQVQDSCQPQLCIWYNPHRLACILWVV